MDLKETIDYCIDSAIKIGEETYDMVLDFSNESVEHVDKILDGYHERYLYPEKDEGLIKSHSNTYAHIFGIYVGEVLIRNHAKDYVCHVIQAGIKLVKYESFHINPITKAYKQIVNGKEGGDDIKSFFEVAIFIVKGSFPK